MPVRGIPTLPPLAPHWCHYRTFVAALQLIPRQLGKLGWITSKLATKQTLRLASQELDRIGGVPGLACQAKDGALWTAGHPIEATMMGTGLAIDLGRAVYRQTVWAGGLVNDMWGSFCDEVCSGSVEEYGAE